MILADTSAWIHYLRHGDAALGRLLMANRVVTCEVILGELLLGAGLPEALHRDLQRLPNLPSPSPARVRQFVQRRLRAFRGSGVGWADASIVTCAVEAGALLFSRDRALRRVWRHLGFREGA